MTKAVWKDVVLAESDKCEEVEGNQYFPPGDVKMEYLKKSDTPYTCPWKGECQYYDVVVEGEVSKDAAWGYPKPKEAAKQIAGHIAFGKDVKVE